MERNFNTGACCGALVRCKTYIIALSLLRIFLLRGSKGIQVYVPLQSGDAYPNAGAIIPPWLCPGWQRIGAGKVFIDWSQKTSSEKRSWSDETAAGSPWPMRATNRSFSAGSVVPHPPSRLFYTKLFRGPRNPLIHSNRPLHRREGMSILDGDIAPSVSEGTGFGRNRPLADAWGYI